MIYWRRYYDWADPSGLQASMLPEFRVSAPEIPPQKNIKDVFATFKVKSGFDIQICTKYKFNNLIYNEVKYCFMIVYKTAFNTSSRWRLNDLSGDC